MTDARAPHRRRRGRRADPRAAHRLGHRARAPRRGPGRDPPPDDHRRAGPAALRPGDHGRHRDPARRLRRRLPDASRSPAPRARAARRCRCRTGRAACAIMTGAALPAGADTVRAGGDASAGRRDGHASRPATSPSPGSSSTGGPPTTGRARRCCRPARCWARRRWRSSPSAARTRWRSRAAPPSPSCPPATSWWTWGSRWRRTQIRSSNDRAIAAALATRGFIDCDRLHLPDDRAVLETALGELLAEQDVLILTGGVSMGEFDYVPQVLLALGHGPGLPQGAAAAGHAALVRRVARGQARVRAARQPGVEPGVPGALRGAGARGGAGRGSTPGRRGAAGPARGVRAGPHLLPAGDAATTAPTASAWRRRSPPTRRATSSRWAAPTASSSCRGECRSSRPVHRPFLRLVGAASAATPCTVAAEAAPTCPAPAAPARTRSRARWPRPRR